MDRFHTDAILIDRPHSARLTHLRPSRTNENNLLARVELCGVCTPEQRIFRGAKQTYPYWGGHEVSAIVERSDNSTLNAGSRIAVALMPRCGHCEACRRGLDNHCAYLHPTPVTDGLPCGPRGFSSVVEVAPYQAISFPHEIGSETVALTEPIACCLRSITQASVRAGDLVSVFGCGTMGRLHAALLSRMGCRVLVADDDAGFRSAAEVLVGLAAPPLPVDDVPAVVNEMSWGEGARAAFCTRGGAVAVGTALRTAARKGVIVLYQSLPASPTIEINLNEIHYREIQVIGTIAQSLRDLQNARDVIVRDPSIRDCISIETLSFSDPMVALHRAISPEINRVMIDFR